MVRASDLLVQSGSGQVLLGLSVGDGDEARSCGVETGRIERGSLELSQRFRLRVHDSITQQLNVAAYLLTRQPKKQLALLGSASVSLAELRIGGVSRRKIELNDDRHTPTVLHCNMTYRLLSTA